MASVLNINELSDLLGVGAEAIRRWRKEGMPATKKNGKMAFAMQPTFDWFLSKGKHKHANVIAGKLGKAEGKAVDLSEIDDLDAYVQRVRFNECALHSMVEGAKNDRNGFVWAYNNYKEACDQRLRVEKEISRIKLDQSKSIPRDEVNREFAEMGQLIKNRMLALPGILAAMLEGKSKPEINDILNKELRKVLEEMSK